LSGGWGAAGAAALSGGWGAALSDRFLRNTNGASGKSKAGPSKAPGRAHATRSAMRSGVAERELCPFETLEPMRRPVSSAAFYIALPRLVLRRIPMASAGQG
jgi:hypothetical protein